MKSSRLKKEGLYRAFIEVEVRLFRKMVDILEFYEQRHGSFNVTEEGPLFTNDIDVDPYNEHVLELQNLLAQESQLSDQMGKLELELIQKMKEHT